MNKCVFVNKKGYCKNKNHDYGKVKMKCYLFQKECPDYKVLEEEEWKKI